MRGLATAVRVPRGRSLRGERTWETTSMRRRSSRESASSQRLSTTRRAPRFARRAALLLGLSFDCRQSTEAALAAACAAATERPDERRHAIACERVAHGSMVRRPHRSGSELRRPFRYRGASFRPSAWGLSTAVSVSESERLLSRAPSQPPNLTTPLTTARSDLRNLPITLTTAQADLRSLPMPLTTAIGEVRKLNGR